MSVSASDGRALATVTIPETAWREACPSEAVSRSRPYGEFAIWRVSRRYDPEFPVDAAIRQFKFHRTLHYARAFGELLCGAAERLPDDIDALLPVPLHWTRHGVRGFNQAAEMCRPLQRATGLPVLRNVRRLRRTPYQSGLGARERRRNLKGAFVVDGSLAARHVLLVDDVITTGETCSQLASTLRANGIPRVSVLALARA